MFRDFLPYATAGKILAITLSEVTLTGSKETVPAEFPVNLSGISWTTCTLELSLSTNIDELLKCLPEQEREPKHLEALARVSGRSVRWRSLIRLEPSVTGGWKGSLTLNRAEVRGLASDAGARLAWSERVAIQTDYLPPSGDHLDIRYESFGASDQSLLKQSGDHAYVLDLTEATSPNPILWLNTDVRGLQRVLDSHATRGKMAAVRDTVNHSISQVVWLELIVAAASAAEDGEGADGWQGSVLKRAARWLDPHGSIELTVNEISRVLGNGDVQGSERQWLVTRLSSAIQRGVPVQRSVRDLLGALEETT
jgi:hypothetical protein